MNLNGIEHLERDVQHGGRTRTCWTHCIFDLINPLNNTSKKNQASMTLMRLRDDPLGCPQEILSTPSSPDSAITIIGRITFSTQSPISPLILFTPVFSHALYACPEAVTASPLSLRRSLIAKDPSASYGHRVTFWWFQANLANSF